MDITIQEMRSRYESMDDWELVDIYRNSTLTDIAKQAIDEEFQKREINPETWEESVEKNTQDEVELHRQIIATFEGSGKEAAHGGSTSSCTKNKVGYMRKKNMIKKITYINSILAAFIAIIFIIFLYGGSPQDFSSPTSWGIALLSALLFVGLIAGVTQLIARIMRAVINKAWAFRLATVTSVLWFLLCVVFIEPLAHEAYDGYSSNYYNMSEFVSIGIIPLVVFWGIIWILKSVTPTVTPKELIDEKNEKTLQKSDSLPKVPLDMYGEDEEQDDENQGYKRLSDRIGQEIHRQLTDAFRGKAKVLENPKDMAFLAGYLSSFTFVAFSELQDCKDSNVHLRQIEYFCEGVLPNRLWDLFQRGQALNQLSEDNEKEEFKQVHDAYETGVNAGIHDVGEFIARTGRPKNLTAFLIGGIVEVPNF